MSVLELTDPERGLRCLPAPNTALGRYFFHIARRSSDNRERLKVAKNVQGKGHEDEASNDLETGLTAALHQATD